LILGSVPTLAGGGAHNEVERGRRLGRSLANAHFPDEVGGLVGCHLHHPFLIEFFTADHNELGNAEVGGDSGRCPDIFRKLRPHQDDSGLAQTTSRHVFTSHNACTTHQ